MHVPLGKIAIGLLVTATMLGALAWLVADLTSEATQARNDGMLVCGLPWIVVPFWGAAALIVCTATWLVLFGSRAWLGLAPAYATGFVWMFVAPAVTCRTSDGVACPTLGESLLPLGVLLALLALVTLPFLKHLRRRSRS